MRSLTRRPKYAAIAAVVAGLSGGPALAGCPWIVQPGDTVVGDVPDYDITFNGEPTRSWNYYAFTVTDHVLAWELSSGSGLATLDDRARPLQVIDDDRRVRYRVDDASVIPLTLYLAVSTAPLPKLDAIDAGFEPARPVAVGLRMRGASDTSGPLPTEACPASRSIMPTASPPPQNGPNARPAYQLCAYQVLIR